MALVEGRGHGLFLPRCFWPPRCLGVKVGDEVAHRSRALVSHSIF